MNACCSINFTLFKLNGHVLTLNLLFRYYYCPLCSYCWLLIKENDSFLFFIQSNMCLLYRYNKSHQFVQKFHTNCNARFAWCCTFIDANTSLSIVFWANMYAFIYVHVSTCLCCPLPRAPWPWHLHLVLSPANLNPVYTASRLLLNWSSFNLI